MSHQTSTVFELQGRFAGFLRDIFGKRRMVLRVAGDERYLKVPKTLRKELEGTLRAGQELIVSGTDVLGEADAHGGPVVSQVRVAGQAACVSCPIRICTKKNCWRDGGRELWTTLEKKIEEAGLGDRVRLKAVGCMDHCKRGPNAEFGGRDFHHCSPRTAEEILESFAKPV